MGTQRAWDGKREAGPRRVDRKTSRSSAVHGHRRTVEVGSVECDWVAKYPGAWVAGGKGRNEKERRRQRRASVVGHGDLPGGGRRRGNRHHHGGSRSVDRRVGHGLRRKTWEGDPHLTLDEIRSGNGDAAPGRRHVVRSDG